MRSLLKFIFGEVFAPLHSLIMKSIAYGPWGPLQPVIIRVFQKLFKIEWQNISEFKNLGAFFLRDIDIKVSDSALVSPAESALVDGPRKISLAESIVVKGIDYRWAQFQELKLEDKTWTVWNFYLAPHNYHWVHSAAAGANLKGYRVSGHRYPVNSLGRWLCPYLYSAN